MYETKGTTDVTVSSTISDVVNIYYSRNVLQQQLMNNIENYLDDFENIEKIQKIKENQFDIITSEKIKYLEQMHQNGLLNIDMARSTLKYMKISNVDLEQFMSLQDKHIFDNLCGNMQNATVDPAFYINMSTISANIANVNRQKEKVEIISDDDNLFFGRDRDISDINNFYNSSEKVLLIHGLRGIGKTKLLKKIESLVIPQPSPWEVYTIQLYKDIGFQAFLDEMLFTLNAPYIEQDGKDIPAISEVLFDFLNRKSAVTIIIDDLNYFIDNSGDFTDSRVKLFMENMIENVKLSHCIKLIISSNRKIYSLERMGITIHEITRLDDDAIRATISYCYRKITNSTDPISVNDKVIKQIYGNPLAAILVAQLLIDNPMFEFDNEKEVFYKFQERLIKNLLSGVNLSPDEEAIMSVLSAAKGSVPIEFIIQSCSFLQPSIEKLSNRFLVEFNHEENTVNMHPLFKEYYYNLLDAPCRNKYHKLYADFYEEYLKNQSKKIRPFILSNLIYHYAGSAQVGKLSTSKRKYIEEVKPIADRLFKDKLYDKALMYYRMIYDTLGDERKDIFIKMAQCCVYNRNIADADKFFKIAIKNNPRGAYLWAQYSIALSSRREYTTQSIKYANTAETVYTENGNSYTWELALIKFSQAKSLRYVNKDKCLKLYDEACTLDPTSPYYLCMYASYLLQCGNSKLAIIKLKQAEIIDSTYDFLKRLKEKIHCEFELSEKEISEITDDNENETIDIEPAESSIIEI